MSTRKRNTGKTKRSGDLLSILLVIVLLAVIAAITAYYLTKKPAHSKKSQTEQLQTKKANENRKTQSPATGNSKATTVLEGTWVSQNDGALLEFHNNTFSLDLPSVDSHSYKKGIFSINGNLITLSYSNTNNACGTQKGIYTFKLSDGSLHLKAKKDDCKFRKQKLVATWDRFDTK